MIKPVGEERRYEDKIKIERCDKIRPNITDINVEKDIIHIRPKTNERIILDIPIKNGHYTSYEVVEVTKSEKVKA